ncbi:hypothetical protein PS15m_001814 [Mucor circinelloides]
MGMDISEESKDLLSVTNTQIMGLEAHIVSLNTADDHLYIARSIKSYTLPSTLSCLNKRCKSIIDNLFDFKHYTLNTAETIKQEFNDKKQETKV